MTVFEKAQRHARFMAGALLLAILFVMVVERFFGHSIVGFGIAALGLIFANARMLRMNCPTCGKNLFFRGPIALPWPNRTCGKCGTELDKPPKS